MSSLTDNEITELKSNKYLDFLTCLNEITNKLKKRDYTFSEFGESLRVIFESDLEINEKCRRASILVSKSLSLIEKEKFVEIISSLPTEIKSGISQSIPKEYLPFIFENRNKKENQTPRPFPPIKKEEITNSITETESKDTAVILLSTIENQNSNISLLRDKGFSVSRIVSDEDLDTQLSSGDICGFVIDGSFWLEKEPNQQDEILKKIAEYSTITCLFVDTSNFHSPIELSDKLSLLHPRTPEFDHLQLRNNSTLTASDLIFFEKSNNLLSKKKSTQILFYDLSEIETTTLIAATNAFYRKECNDQTKVLKSLRIKTVHGGRSYEKTVAVYFDDGTSPCIAKIGKQCEIMNEYNRFKHFIHVRDNRLKPYVHFHAGVGVLINSAICNPVNPSELAPTLESQVLKASREEIWKTDNNLENQCNNLKIVLCRTIEKLHTLNSYPLPDNYNSFQTYAYLHGSSLKDLEISGVNFNLPNISSDDLVKSIKNANEILDPHKNSAMVHGDINLRNVLVLDNTDSYLIDYYTVSVFHPAHDLVRLECAITFQFLRALGSEEDFIKLQKSISVDINDFEVVKSQNSIWFKSDVNKTLIESIIICRDKCIELLKAKGLDESHYKAAKFIMSCDSIALPEFQMGYIRGAIRTFAPEFNYDK